MYLPIQENQVTISNQSAHIDFSQRKKKIYTRTHTHTRGISNIYTLKMGLKSKTRCSQPIFQLTKTLQKIFVIVSSSTSILSTFIAVSTTYSSKIFFPKISMRLSFELLNRPNVLQQVRIMLVPQNPTARQLPKNPPSVALFISKTKWGKLQESCL